jgi:hypothetical protein
MMQGELFGGLMTILGCNGTLFIVDCGKTMIFSVEIFLGRSLGLMALFFMEAGSAK